jgi:hypothetical protein
MTMATPSTTPSTVRMVTADVIDRFGFRYFDARKKGKGIAS